MGYSAGVFINLLTVSDIFQFKYSSSLILTLASIAGTSFSKIILNHSKFKVNQYLNLSIMLPLLKNYNKELASSFSMLIFSLLTKYILLVIPRTFELQLSHVVFNSFKTSFKSSLFPVNLCIFIKANDLSCII